MTEESKQPELPVLETAKGRIGNKVVYHPLGPDGKPVVFSKENRAQVYNKKGGIETTPEASAPIVDTKA